MLLVFILEVKIYGVVSYTQETEFGRGQKVSGTELDREEPKLPDKDGKKPCSSKSET